MKHRILRTGLSALIILLLLSSTAAYATGDIVYTNSRWLADNLEYTNTVKWSSVFGRTESFTVSMAGPGDAYPIVINGDTIFGSTRISGIVSYAESLGMNVLAAVNADFFSMQTGVPLGIVIEDGVYKSSPSDRGAVCFGYNGGAFFITTPSVSINLFNNGGGAEADNAGKTVNLSNYNKFRMDTGGLYLFSEAFSTVSTRTTSPGWFVILKILEGTPSVSGTMQLEVTGKLMSDDAVPIGEGYMILSAAMLGGFIAEYEKFSVGDIVTLTTTCNDERLADAQYATGAGDILLSDGLRTDPESWDTALLPRNPRTAFGIRADGAIVSYVVDGRDSTHSVGLTLDELIDEMQRLGCVYAINLDGGGSSALSLRIPGLSNAEVVSRPSGGSERGCATYILFVTDAVPGGAARNLNLRNDGVIVLSGSSVELSFTATDRGYMPAGIPDDIQVTPGSTGASVDGAVYTSGGAAGADTLSLYSPSTGANGTGQVFVITRPTSITPSRKGSSAPLTSVKLLPGDILELDVAATFYRRAVVAQVHSFTYSVTGDIGEMTEPGLFLAGQTMQQTGTITVSADGRSAEIKVEIGGFLDMQNHWAREYADYLASIGIVTGVTPVSYDPERMMSRGDFCLMLYRAAGLPAFDETGAFNDVPAEAYYARAVSWAREMGIAEAVENNDFYPSRPLARQDTFTWIYRTLGLLNKQYTDGTKEDLAGFPDADSLAEYAVIPTATLIKLGLVGGMDGRLEPNGSLTRAQMAKIIATVIQL